MKKAVLACAVAVVASGAPSAQVCDPPTMLDPDVRPEIFFDDVPPHQPWLPPTLVTHKAALKAMVVDIDKVTSTGRRELVIGGNGDSPAVKAFWFIGQSWWVDTGSGCIQFLEDANLNGKGASLCYDFALDDVNEDGFPDITVARRLPSSDPSLIDIANGPSLHGVPE